MRVGGIARNTLKDDGIEKRGVDKNFKKVGQAGLKGRCLKNGEGGWNPLKNYV